MRQMPLFLHAFLLLLASASGALAAGNNWMTSLDGSLLLSQYSLPGTHDSGALYEPISGTAKCQNLSIADQLSAGVRFLDVRCRHVNNAFAIQHGQVYENASFDDVLGAVISFLNANPSEAVVMSVKEEYTASGDTRSFEATFDSYVAKNPTMWNLAADVPTLAAARGKITLFRRFAATSLPKGFPAVNWPDNTTFSIGTRLRVQDNYNVSDNDTKWSQILAILNEARTGSPSTLYVNFSSGVASGAFGIPDITSVSDDINPRLTTFFNANPSGRFGAIMMDFANAARCALIYNTNPISSSAAAQLAAIKVATESNGNATLSWTSQSGYLYQPVWSSDLNNWQPLTDNPLLGDGSVQSVADGRKLGRCFYRVEVSPAS